MAYVYILQSGTENIFKVGRTKRDVDARIQQLSTGNPYPLTKFEVIETEHDALCESYLHRRLSTKKIFRGLAQEFFAITLPILVLSSTRPGHTLTSGFQWFWKPTRSQCKTATGPS